MTCHKCQGLMYIEKNSGGMTHNAQPLIQFACYNCSERLDYAILRNRELQRAGKLVDPRLAHQKRHNSIPVQL